MNIEYIKWKDSYGCSSSWGEIGDHLPKPAVCESAGFLLKEDSDYIVIAGHYHGSDDDIGSIASACGEMAIPKCSIIERKILMEVKCLI